MRALGLSSGGLDSLLAALVLKDQGIEVEWINFETPFFSAEKARESAETSSIPLTVLDITSEYLKMLKNPPCGFGKNMNPCLDCHALMFRKAGKIMEDKGFDFLFSGEVLGQRPMSQTRPSLRYVEKASGFEGYILRPLSAKLLPATIPERQGKVDGNLLLDFSGRSRKPQIKLARQFGINRYPSPAGGCLLTDKCYSDRLRDLFKHQGDNFTKNDLFLLKYGRHIRLDGDTKIIVGRTKKDNNKIMSFYQSEIYTMLKVESFPGPVALMPQGINKDSILMGAAICAGYSKAPSGEVVDVVVTKSKGDKSVQVKVISPSTVKDLII